VRERFVVRYVVDWEGDPRKRFYPSLPVAEAFAKQVTTDGTTTFPHIAIILRQTRDGDYGEWRDDPDFGAVEISRGARTHAPGDPG
jgi:hypothetical protein